MRDRQHHMITVFCRCTRGLWRVSTCEKVLVRCVNTWRTRNRKTSTCQRRDRFKIRAVEHTKHDTKSVNLSGDRAFKTLASNILVHINEGATKIASCLTISKACAGFFSVDAAGCATNSRWWLIHVCFALTRVSEVVCTWRHRRLQHKDGSGEQDENRLQDPNQPSLKRWVNNLF